MSRSSRLSPTPNEIGRLILFSNINDTAGHKIHSTWRWDEEGYIPLSFFLEHYGTNSEVRLSGDSSPPRDLLNKLISIDYLLRSAR